jgi:hypothetical protein
LLSQALPLLLIAAPAVQQLDAARHTLRMHQYWQNVAGGPADSSIAMVEVPWLVAAARQ